MNAMKLDYKQIQKHGAMWWLSPQTKHKR